MSPTIDPGSMAGFTLVEALIAMFVLAFGLLGCASLLAWSLFEGNAALRREQALVAASDLAERVRANGGVPGDAVFAEWQAQIAAHSPLLAAPEATLTVVPPANATDLERIDVALRWFEPRAADGTDSLVLHVHRRPDAE
jgi:type IV pilus modification protein PilV